VGACGESERTVNRYLRVIAAGFLLLSVFSGFVLVDLADNYAKVVEVSSKLAFEVPYGISELRIPPVTDKNQSVPIAILFVVANPGRLEILITDVTVNFYLDRPCTVHNLETRIRDDYVWTGTSPPLSRAEYYAVAVGKTISFWLNFTVPSELTSRFEERLDNGNYCPLVRGRMTYTFTEIEELQFLPVFYFRAEVGVPPYVG